MKSKSIILSSMFLSSLALISQSCNKSPKEEDVKDEWVNANSSMQTRTDHNGNRLVYYAGLWYMMNARNQFNPYQSAVYRYNGSSGFSPTQRPNFRSGGFGSTGDDRSVGG
jgi:hypothetical protein